MRPLFHNFLKTLTSSCQISRGSNLVAAVSGGPDSIALLHLLAGVQQQLQLRLTAVWVDHGLRPEETPLKKWIVSDATKKLGIPFIPYQVDAASYAAEQRISLEHAARDLRYTVLRETARQEQAKYIAVAHTADDQAEEILLRFLSGKGSRGKSGMRMCSQDVIRPLLGTSKQDLLSWLADQNIEYCIDSSNNNPKFLRKRVRHHLLPFLEEHFDAGIKKSLRKTADSLVEDEQLLAELTAEAEKDIVREVAGNGSGEPPKVRILRQPFCVLHASLRRRLVEQLLWRIGSGFKYDHILLILEAAVTGKNNSELHLSRGLRLGVFHEYLEFSYPFGQKTWSG
ncbi:MAG: tRNA lysidine(34) synthetase TilS [Candidatus Electrothrix sp. AR4]|nr:tRNA lysidine(34) synthetase TilS [Candidatus Electrothrix sp. AR4]